MKILILEDELPAARRLMKLLQAAEPRAQLIGPLESVEETLSYLNTHGEPDLYMMDIQLADGLSFELFEQFPIKKPVIFTTAFDDYAIKAFKVNSIDYLLKPLDDEALQKALTKFKENALPQQPDFVRLLDQLRPKNYKQRFLLKKGERLIPLSVEQIAYFQASGKMVVLVSHTKENFIVDQTLDSLQAELDPSQFYRANRGFLVSVACIKEVNQSFNGKLKLRIEPKPNDDEVSVSREKAAEFKDWLDA